MFDQSGLGTHLEGYLRGNSLESMAFSYSVFSKLFIDVAGSMLLTNPLHLLPPVTPRMRPANRSRLSL